MDFTQTEPVLRAVVQHGSSQGPGRAAAAELDLDSMAREANLEPLTVRLILGWSFRCGLIADDPSVAAGQGTTLTGAGWQYLDLDGQVSVDVLNFLPEIVDDLYARRAILIAGADAVATFRGCLLSGTGIEHARDLVPAAYEAMVDWDLTLGLYAATAAAMARLSAQEAAACVAEDIVLVNLIDSARKWLIVDGEFGQLERWHAGRAKRALAGLLKLVRDPALPSLFASNAVVNDLDLGSAAALVDDYPSESWFRPYPGACPTGHLDFTCVE